MAGLLAGMEKKWKEKIVEANRAEKKEKAWYESTMHSLEPKRLAWRADEGRNTYEMLENYWTKHRALEHRQYHNLLKIAHAGIMKFKAAARALDDAGAGKSLDV